jgi:hypothetical protein
MWFSARHFEHSKMWSEFNKVQGCLVSLREYRILKLLNFMDVIIYI